MLPGGRTGVSSDRYVTTNASVMAVVASHVAAHLHIIEGCTVDVEYERSLGRRAEAEANIPAARALADRVPTATVCQSTAMRGKLAGDSHVQ